MKSLKKKKRKFKFPENINKRRLLAAITILIVLGLFLFNVPRIYEFFMYSDFQTVDGLVGGDYLMERYGDDMLCYNNKTMSLVTPGGDVEWVVNISTTMPKVIVKDDYILLVDLSGNTAYLYDEDTKQAEMNLSEEIFAAALDEDGNIALASKKQGYKGAVAVFNKDGEKQYEFSSGEGYISALDIRGKEIAVSQVTADEDGVSSRIILVNWKDNEEKQCENKSDRLVFDLKFRAGGDIIALSDKDLTGYEDDGEVDFKVNFEGRALKQYNIDSDDNMVFCFEGERNNSIIKSYSQRGKLRGERSESGEITNIDVCGEVILINDMRQISRVYPDGDIGEAIVSQSDVKGIKMFASRRQALITGNSRTTVAKIKK